MYFPAGCLLSLNEMGHKEVLYILYLLVTHFIHTKNLFATALVTSWLPWLTLACVEDAEPSVDTHQLLS